MKHRFQSSGIVRPLGYNPNTTAVTNQGSRSAATMSGFGFPRPVNLSAGRPVDPASAAASAMPVFGRGGPPPTGPPPSGSMAFPPSRLGVLSALGQGRPVFGPQATPPTGPPPQQPPQRALLAGAGGYPPSSVFNKPPPAPLGPVSMPVKMPPAPPGPVSAPVKMPPVPSGPVSSPVKMPPAPLGPVSSPVKMPTSSVYGDQVTEQPLPASYAAKFPFKPADSLHSSQPAMPLSAAAGSTTPASFAVIKSSDSAFSGGASAVSQSGGAAGADTVSSPVKVGHSAHQVESPQKTAPPALMPLKSTAADQKPMPAKAETDGSANVKPAGAVSELTKSTLIPVPEAGQTSSAGTGAKPSESSPKSSVNPPASLPTDSATKSPAEVGQVKPAVAPPVVAVSSAVKPISLAGSPVKISPTVSVTSAAKQPSPAAIVTGMAGDLSSVASSPVKLSPVSSNQPSVVPDSDKQSSSLAAVPIPSLTADKFAVGKPSPAMSGTEKIPPIVTSPSKPSDSVTSPTKSLPTVPAKTSSTATASPAKTSLTVTASPAKTSPTVTASPAKTSLTATASPAKTLPTVTASSAKTLSTVTASPAKVLPAVSASPAKTSPTVSASPSKALPAVSASPVKAPPSGRATKPDSVSPVKKDSLTVSEDVAQSDKPADSQPVEPAVDPSVKPAARGRAAKAKTPARAQTSSTVARKKKEAVAVDAAKSADKPPTRPRKRKVEEMSSPATASPREAGKRSRVPTRPFQASLSDFESIPQALRRASAAAAAGGTAPVAVKSPDHKLTVFFKNEFLAVRNEDGGYFVCQVAQNVSKTTRKVRVRWMTPNGNVYTPDFYDNIDFDSILTSLEMRRLGREKHQLGAAEALRADNILKKALARDAGELPDPDPSAEGQADDGGQPYGLDISMYNDESQLVTTPDKKAAGRRGGRKRKASATAAALKDDDGEETRGSSPARAAAASTPADGCRGRRGQRKPVAKAAKSTAKPAAATGRSSRRVAAVAAVVSMEEDHDEGDEEEMEAEEENEEPTEKASPLQEKAETGGRAKRTKVTSPMAEKPRGAAPRGRAAAVTPAAASKRQSRQPEATKRAAAAVEPEIAETSSSPTRRGSRRTAK